MAETPRSQNGGMSLTYFGLGFTVAMVVFCAKITHDRRKEKRIRSETYHKALLIKSSYREMKRNESIKGEVFTTQAYTNGQRSDDSCEEIMQP